MSDEEIMKKIREILDDEKMRTSVKLANIHYLLNERYKYFTKPYYTV